MANDIQSPDLQIMRRMLQFGSSPQLLHLLVMEREITMRRGQFLILVLGLLPVMFAGCNTTVKLRSTPTGATVSEMHKGQIGTTPTTVEMEEDDEMHDFVFRKNGYKEKRVRKQISGSTVIVHAPLTRDQETSLNVRTKPESASVTVTARGKPVLLPGGEQLYEGSDEGVSIRSDELWNGRDSLTFTVKVDAPLYEDTQRELRITRGTEQTLDISLKPRLKEVRVEIDSKPEGAKVYDRQMGFLGITPLEQTISVTELLRHTTDPEGTAEGTTQLHLRFQKEGYQDVRQSMDIDLNENPNRFSIDLETPENK